MNLHHQYMKTSISFYIFDHNNPKKEWYDNMVNVVCELKKIKDICLLIDSRERKPTRGDLTIILNAALKFHSGDCYYTALEGSEVIDAGYVGAMVFDVIDKYFSVSDVVDMLFGGNIFLKEEFVHLKERTQVSTSGCMKFMFPY